MKKGKILVSFCNLPIARSTGVLAVDPATGSHGSIDLGLRALVTSCTGLSSDGEHIFVLALSGGVHYLVSLRQSTLTPVFSAPLPEIKDGHSLAIDNKRIYIASTGTDEVVGYDMTPDGVQNRQIVWRAGNTGSDTHHVNSVATWRGRIVVSAFGPKSGALWATASNGYIHDITGDVRIKSGIYHPHTLSARGESLYYCESHRALFCSLEKPLFAYDGYTRGICWLSDELVCMATSVGRTVSKSTGMIANPADPGTPAGTCGISVREVSTGRIVNAITLDTFGPEIYDLLFLEEDPSSPEHGADHGTSGAPAQRTNGPAGTHVNASSPLSAGAPDSYFSFPRKEVLNLILRHGLPATAVLEIGCAGGATGKLIKEARRVEEYTGIELSEQAARIARQYLDTVIVANIEQVDLEKDHGVKHGHYDLLLALDVLEHLYDPWDVLAGLRRFLKPGGHLIASIPNIQNIAIIKDLVRGRWQYENAGILDATHLRFFTLRESRKMIEGAGLTIQHIDRVMNPPLDMSKVKDSGNRLVQENLSISGLSKDEVTDLFTYQFIMLAQNGAHADPAAAPALPDAACSSQGTDDRLTDRGDMKMVNGLTSIVILTYNQLDYTKECVNSIQKHTPEPHEILFIDNGSTDGTRKWLNDLVKKNAQYRLIENTTNLGFSAGCNQGIKAASGEYILLLNNDVVVAEHWLSGMLECLNSSRDIGFVGPMTNSISGPQKVEDASYSIRSLDAYSKGFRDRHRHRRIPLRRVVGFCMLFRRGLTDRIGLLDEDFGTGNYEDDDFCLRSALAGFRNVIAGDVFIHHYGSASFRGNDINYRSAMTGNRKRYKVKWGAVKADSETGRSLIVVQALEKAAELSRKDQSERAVSVLIDAIKRAPDDKRIYTSLAGMLLESKQYEQALAVIDRMPPDERDPDRLCLAGYCKEGLGLYDEAADLAVRALALRSNHAPAINLQGVVAVRKNDRPAAQALFKKAIEADPGYGEPYTNIGVLLWSGGDHHAGLDLLEKGFILAPLSSDAASLYFSAAASAEAIPRAERALREVRFLYPDLRRILFLLIDACLRQEKHGEAMALTQEAMITFDLDDGLLAAALGIRARIGPKEIPSTTIRSGALSVCMIVKNEEAHLPRCLMSIDALADEVIIVDTGSTDRTRDIAAAFGAKVFDLPWSGDFAEARNASLEKASGGWIFVLDADEVISPKDHEALKRLMLATKKTPAAYSVTTRNYISAMNITGWTMNDGEYAAEEAGSGWNPSTKTRLFTNDPRIRFENRVHELVEASLARINVSPKPCTVPVHHYGKLKEDKVMKKGEDYFLLGREKLRETSDFKALYELAVQAGELDRFDDAIELWEQFLRMRDLPQEFFLRGHINLGYALVQRGRYDEAFEISKKALALSPEAPGAVMNYSLAELWRGDPQKAVPYLEKLLQTIPDYPPAVGMLAIAALCANDAASAQRIFKQLKAQGFLSELYLLHHVEKLMEAGRADRAIVILQNAIAAGSGSPKLNNALEDCRKRAGA